MTTNMFNLTLSTYYNESCGITNITHLFVTAKGPFGPFSRAGVRFYWNLIGSATEQGDQRQPGRHSISLEKGAYGDRAIALWG